MDVYLYYKLNTIATQVKFHVLAPNKSLIVPFIDLRRGKNYFDHDQITLLMMDNAP